MRKRRILDSSALIKFLACEEGADIVKKELEKAQEEKQNIFLSVINLGEVYYIIKKKFDKDKADQTIDLLSNLPISLLSVSKETALKAALLKSDYDIPFIDAICAATAIIENAIIITSDFDFKKVKSQVESIWV